MGARFCAQAGALLVVLLDVGLRVPGFQTIVLLRGAVHATAGAIRVKTTLKQTGDDVGLANGPADIQESSKQSVQAIARTKDQVVAALYLIQIPRITEALFARRRREEGNALVDPAFAEGFDGFGGQRSTGLLERLDIADGD